MKTFEFDAVVYNGEVLCTECLPNGVFIHNNEEVTPIFADSEHDSYPVCSKCGAVHNYVNLTAVGKAYEPNRKFADIKNQFINGNLNDFRIEIGMFEWWEMALFLKYLDDNRPSANPIDEINRLAQKELEKS